MITWNITFVKSINHQDGCWTSAATSRDFTSQKTAEDALPKLRKPIEKSPQQHNKATKANSKALKPVGKEGKAPQQHDKAKKANPKAPKPVGKEGKAPKPVKKGGGEVLQGRARISFSKSIVERCWGLVKRGQKKRGRKWRQRLKKVQLSSQRKLSSQRREKTNPEPKNNRSNIKQTAELEVVDLSGDHDEESPPPPTATKRCKVIHEEEESDILI